MKIGIRKPSLKKSLKAKTTGKLKRSVKKAVNPLYGKKGMGLINNPKKAVYNKVYNKTTIGVSDLMKVGTSTSKTTQSKKASSTVIEQHNHIDYAITSSKTNSYSPKTYSPKAYKIFGAFIKICAILIVFLSLILLTVVPVGGTIFTAIGIGLFFIGRGYTQKAKVLSIEEVGGFVNDSLDEIMGEDVDDITTEENYEE